MSQVRSKAPREMLEGEKEFVINNPLVRIHFAIHEMIWWTGLEFPFPGSLI